MAREKTIIISDIHMSNGKSYSWFKGANSKNLTAMLNAIADGVKDEFINVKELVLLGDLFDLWLYPVTERPCTVEEIIAANEPVRKALQRCVQKIPVYYMSGNHDMGVKAKDLKPFNAGGKKIILVNTRTYKKIHQSWHLEHGHLADMFNAPDKSGDTIGGYPLGYFMTRLAAKAPRTVWQKVQEVITESHDDLHRDGVAYESAIASTGAWLVEGIIDALLTTGDVEASTTISFVEPALNGKYTVNDIKKYYWSLYGRWYRQYGPFKILDTMLASRHFVGLDWHANELLSAPKPPKVIVMGHTHRSLKHGVYSNDGCCCGQGCLSYVEIVADRATVKNWP
jgi:predicted phosphodiesterase